MLGPVRSSIARASTRHNGFVCLSCRVQRRRVTTATVRDAQSSAPPPSMLTSDHTLKPGLGTQKQDESATAKLKSGEKRSSEADVRQPDHEKESFGQGPNQVALERINDFYQEKMQQRAMDEHFHWWMQWIGAGKYVVKVEMDGRLYISVPLTDTKIREGVSQLIVLDELFKSIAPQIRNELGLARETLGLGGDLVRLATVAKPRPAQENGEMLLAGQEMISQEEPKEGVKDSSRSAKAANLSAGRSRRRMVLRGETKRQRTPVLARGTSSTGPLRSRRLTSDSPIRSMQRRAREDQANLKAAEEPKEGVKDSSPSAKAASVSVGRSRRRMGLRGAVERQGTTVLARQVSSTGPPLLYQDGSEHPRSIRLVQSWTAEDEKRLKFDLARLTWQRYTTSPASHPRPLDETAKAATDGGASFATSQPKATSVAPDETVFGNRRNVGVLRFFPFKDDSESFEDTERGSAEESRYESVAKPAEGTHREPGEKPRAESRPPKPLVGAKTMLPLSLEQDSLEVPTNEVPGLQYGLDRVLFNQGVYRLQDPRSRVYNFDPYLQKIVEPKNFDFAKLDDFQTPSKDGVLSRVASERKIKYYSSTSAITPVLAHFHFLISNFRPLHFDDLSHGFLKNQYDKRDAGEYDGEFATFLKSPQSIYLKPKEDGYAIDRAVDETYIGLLSFVGQCLEKLFTVPKEVFEAYKKGSEVQPETMNNGYNYTRFGEVLVRSQLDAHDSRLPGTGVFDIKTRAVLPIRMDPRETMQETTMNYEIKHINGEYESFERELHDLYRATMLKYMLQARLGRMDGIFIAYHNIARMFGFQYLSIADMDKVLHGQTDPAMGDAELGASFGLLSEIFEKATASYPGEPLRLWFSTRQRTKDIVVCVAPVTVQEIEQQHVRSQRISKDYLAKINRSENEDDEAANETSADELGAEDTDVAELGPTAQGAEDIQAEADATERAQPGVLDESIRDTIDRLLTQTSTLSMETETLQDKDRRPKSTGSYHLMIRDISTATFRLGRDVARLEAAIKAAPADEVPQGDHHDALELRQQLDRQLAANEELYQEAASQDMLSGSQISELKTSQTLGDALKATAKPKRVHTPPERLAVFVIKAQSLVDGVVTQSPLTNVTKDTKWELQYTVKQVESETDAQNMYVQTRKKMDSASLHSADDKRLRDFYESGWFKKLVSVSRRAAEWRREQDELDREREVVVFEPRA